MKCHLLLSSLLLALSIHGWAGAKLTIPATVTVHGASVRLSDVATIEGTEHECAQLNSVTLGAAPLVGENCTFSLGAIRMRLRQAGVDPTTVTIDCPSSVTVTRPAMAVDGAMLVSLADQWLRDRLPVVAGEELTLTPLRVPANLQLPEGKLSWQYEETGGAGGATRGVLLSALVDGKSAWHGVITLRVQRTRSVLVLKSAVSRYQVLSEEMIGIERRDVSAIRGELLGDPHEAVGQRVVCLLAAGTVLTTGMLEAVPTIKKNEAVQVQARCGGLLVVTTAIACEDGQTGASIRVKNEATRLEFSARVIGPGRLDASL